MSISVCTKKGSSLSNTETVPQTRSEPYIQRYNLNTINCQELLFTVVD